jgi:hypothetical protein
MNIKHSVELQDYITPVKTISSIEIQIVNLVLFTSVNVMVMLYDENDNIIDNKYFNIEGTEYTDWASDDNYLLELILSKLNLTKKLI